VARRVLLALICVGAYAQLLPPPPPDPNPPKYAAPPEEDETLATAKVYSFNPLQAKKELATGDFYMKRGNFKGAAYRYREATQWDDGSPEAFRKLGEASEKLKDYDTAREAFTRYLALADNKKIAGEIRKRLAKYPAGSQPAKPVTGVGLGEALKEDRGADAMARANGIIR
jgi:tetratricopeptide (TPR) repeat protein